MAKHGDAASALDDHQSISVSVEKISNGYLKRTSTEGPGGYKCETEYCETKPEINLTAPKAESNKSSKLAEAIKCLK